MAGAQGDLLELVQTERQLDAELAAARAEAARIVAQSRTGAEQRIQALDEDVERALAELRRSSDADVSARVAALEQDATRQALAFERAPGTLIATLAGRMVARLVALEEAP